MKHHFFIAEFFQAYDELTPSHVYGYLNLYDSSIKSLGNLTHINNSLTLRYSKISSLGKLEEVGGDLDLYASTITSLGNLSYVFGKYFNIGETRITSLGKLTEFDGTIWCSKEKYYDMLQAQNNGRFKIKLR